MPRKSSFEGHKVLLELRAAELAMIDRACALTGQPRVQMIRKGAVEHARRLCCALEQITGSRASPGGVPILQSGLAAELRAADVAPPNLYDDDDDGPASPGGTDHEPSSSPPR
jgi:hypothetical protein